MINVEIDNSTEIEKNIIIRNFLAKNDSNNVNFTVNETKNINYKSSYRIKYQILGINFIGFYIGYNQYLYINNETGLRQNYVNLVLNDADINLSSISM